MSKEKDKQGQTIWREMTHSQNFKLAGYVLAAIIAATTAGWFSTALKSVMPEMIIPKNGLPGLVFLIFTGFLFLLLILIPVGRLRETRAGLKMVPNARHALNQLPSDGDRILLLFTLLLFALAIDTGKDLLTSILNHWLPTSFRQHSTTDICILPGKDACQFAARIVDITHVVISGVMLLLWFVFQCKLNISNKKNSGDITLAIVFLVTGCMIEFFYWGAPLSVFHYLWLAFLCGYLFLDQVRRHAVPTNMLKETDDVKPHRHLILFVSICSTYKLKLDKEQWNKIKKNQQNPEYLSNKISQINNLIQKWLLQYCIKNENNSGNQDKNDDQLSCTLDGEMLVNILSQYISWHLTNKNSESTRDDHQTFSELIGNYDAILSDLGTTARTNWRMLFVALEKHQLSARSDTKGPQIISFIVSNLGYRQGKKNANAGSNLQIHTLIKLLSLYLIYNNLSHTHIEFHLYKNHPSQHFTRITSKHLDHFISDQDNASLSKLLSQISVDQYLPAFSPDGNSSKLNETDYGADFYEFDSCMQAVQRLVTNPSAEIKEWETIIDFTSGNKVASMVATFMTTTSDVKAQYVDEMYNVKPFDLRYYDLAKLGG